jgi:hypothetical protein
MHALSATKMTAMVQPITIPTRVLTGMVIPLLPPFSFSAVDVEEMAGEVGALALGLALTRRRLWMAGMSKISNVFGFLS